MGSIVRRKIWEVDDHESFSDYHAISINIWWSINTVVPSWVSNFKWVLNELMTYFHKVLLTQALSTDYIQIIFKGLMIDANWMRVGSSLSNENFVERHQLITSHSTTGQNSQKMGFSPLVSLRNIFIKLLI